MSNDRINELPICAKLTREYTRIPGTGQRLVNPDGPEAAALIGELVGLIRKHITFAERKFPQSVTDEAEAALAKARAQ